MIIVHIPSNMFLESRVIILTNYSKITTDVQEFLRVIFFVQLSFESKSIHS